MFVVVHNEDDMEALRAMPLKFKKVFKEVLELKKYHFDLFFIYCLRSV